MPRLVGILTPQSWLRLIVTAWANVLVRKELAASAAEVNRLAIRIGKKINSIWDMNKEELVEVARKELGMNPGQAQAETVVTLRERIRRVRELTKLENLDPEAQLPKGLGAMKLADLVEEVNRRQLPLPDKPTRAQLQILIRDDVSFRASVLTTDQAQSMSAADPNGHEEWDMCVDERNKRANRKK